MTTTTTDLFTGLTEELHLEYDRTSYVILAENDERTWFVGMADGTELEDILTADYSARVRQFLTDGDGTPVGAYVVYAAHARNEAPMFIIHP